MKSLSRRELLRFAGIGGAAAMAAACQPKVVEVTTVVEKVVKETVEVEVEKVVKEAVEVEKEVTRVVEKEVEVEVEKAAGPEVTITQWNGFTGYDRPCLENLFNLFNSFREDIEMDYTVRPWDGIQETLAPAWAAGEGPDFVLVPSVWIPAYADAGLLLSMDDLIAGPNGMDADAWVPMCMDCHRLNGQVYGICMGVNNWGLYYNKDILEAAGWDPESPPTTQDELVECATMCQTDDIWGFPVPYTDTTYFFSTLMCMGGTWIKDGKVGLDGPEPADTSRWLRSFIENGLAPDGGGDMGGLFQAGKSALYLGGPWMTGGFTAAGLNYAVTPWVDGVTKGTQGGALGYSIFHQTPYAEQCWEFIKWWQKDEVQIPWCECSGYPSANPLLAEHPRIIGNELIYPFQIQALYAEAPAPGVIPHAEVSRVWRETVEATLYGEDPDELWAEAAEETREILRGVGQLNE